MTDKYYGQGGSYIVDPKTGARKLVNRTGKRAEPAPKQPIAPDETE